MPGPRPAEGVVIVSDVYCIRPAGWVVIVCGVYCILYTPGCWVVIVSGVYCILYTPGWRSRDCVRCIRGVFKKFAAQPRRKTNFTTKRGVRDVTLLKRPLTQPLANRSPCFAQAVGCCKNVFYFCRTQRRSAGSSDSIRSVTEKSRKGYP